MSNPNAPTLHPEMTLQDAALATAGYVFALEADTVREESRDHIKWQSLPAFEDPLSLSQYAGKGEPSLTFHIGGDMADELVVYTRTAEDLRLENDAYAEYFLDRYLGIIKGHEHDICTHIIKKMLQQKQKRADLFQSLEDRNQATTASFAIVAKDSMRSDYAQGQLLSWLQDKSA